MSVGIRNLACALIAPLLLASPQPAFAQTAPTGQAVPPHGDTVIATRHQIKFGNGTLHYTAHAGLLPIYVNDTGERMASIFFIAYIADTKVPRDKRPITFLWNGGPGSNSAQVHVAGFGPRRVVTADTMPDYAAGGQTAMADHEETLLGSSDLVFIDPVGTGFSRATSQTYRDILYTARGDAEAVAEAIRIFMNRYDRWQSPLYIGGESYGTIRAGLVADMLETRREHVSGVLMISGALDLGPPVPPNLAHALTLVDLAAPAYYHRTMAADLLALPQDDALKQAEQWARTVYAPALDRIASLSPDERAQIVAGIRRFLGVRPQLIDPKTLLVDPTAFSDNLLADQGLELGRYDSRMKLPRRAPGATWMPWADPSLLPMVDLLEGTSPLFNAYVRNDLGFRSDLFYRGPFGKSFHPEPIKADPETGYGSDWMAMMFKWDAAGFAPREEQPLRRAMRANPRLRVYNMLGLYDGNCAGRAQEIAQIADDLRPRVSSACYVGGHMFYSDRKTRQQVQRDFADFVAASTTPDTDR
ncbi:hypothetical protein Q4610_11050 [Sphingobium sp. HBC34]|uniref:Peptidase S10 n=1 Tax=Sphingobium cyanobacteriorum TaxID=3063954 RepID=A0ABT8ZM28_9SPHN|nr:hypothetical protein [Sphingobium sp. HBC34]MDO7835580.1 hypothetical protein [Sphingobium sp. HBC34]